MQNAHSQISVNSGANANLEGAAYLEGSSARSGKYSASNTRDSARSQTLEDTTDEIDALSSLFKKYESTEQDNTTPEPARNEMNPNNRESELPREEIEERPTTSVGRNVPKPGDAGIIESNEKEIALDGFESVYEPKQSEENLVKAEETRDSSNQKNLIDQTRPPKENSEQFQLSPNENVSDDRSVDPKKSGEDQNQILGMNYEDFIGSETNVRYDETNNLYPFTSSKTRIAVSDEKGSKISENGPSPMADRQPLHPDITESQPESGKEPDHSKQNEYPEANGDGKEADLGNNSDNLDEGGSNTRRNDSMNQMIDDTAHNLMGDDFVDENKAETPSQDEDAPNRNNRFTEIEDTSLPEGLEVVDTLTPMSEGHFGIPAISSLSDLPPLVTSPRHDAEYKRQLTEFKQTHSLPDKQMYPKLLQYIQREKINSVVSGNYQEASALQALSMQLVQIMSEMERKELMEKRMQTLKDKIAENEEQMKLLKKNFAKEIAEEKERLTQRRYEIKEQQAAALDAFEDRWNDSGFLQKFARPSTALRRVKYMERSMVLTKLFDQAVLLKKQAADLEKAENKEAQLRARVAMEKERQKLFAKHDLEWAAFEEHCQRSLDALHQAHEHQMKRAQVRQTKLLFELNSVQPTLPPILSKTSEPAHSVMTPRTAQRYSLYKSFSKPPTIAVKPLGQVIPTKARKRGHSTRVGNIV